MIVHEDCGNGVIIFLDEGLAQCLSCGEMFLFIEVFGDYQFPDYDRLMAFYRVEKLDDL